MILLRLLKNNRAGGAVFVILLMLLQLVNSFIHPSSVSDWNTMPFYNLIFEPLHSLPILSAITAFFLIGIMAIMLVRLNVKYFLIDDRSFMPAAIFILLVSSFAPLRQVNPVLVGSLFLLITIVILFNAHEDKPDSLRIFNASLVLGLGSMFYLNLIWFVPLLWLVILIIRPIRWRELVYPIVVYFLLSLFIFTYYWVFRNDLALLTDILAKNLYFPASLAIYSNSWLIFIGFVLFLMLLASIYLLQRIQGRKIVIRKLYQVFFVIFLYTLLYDLFISKMLVEVIYILAIPVTYLLSNFFHRKRNHWINELLMWIWFGVIVYMQIST